MAGDIVGYGDKAVNKNSLPSVCSPERKLSNKIQLTCQEMPRRP